MFFTMRWWRNNFKGKWHDENFIVWFAVCLRSCDPAVINTASHNVLFRYYRLSKWKEAHCWFTQQSLARLFIVSVSSLLNPSPHCLKDIFYIPKVIYSDQCTSSITNQTMQIWESNLSLVATSERHQPPFSFHCFLSCSLCPSPRFCASRITKVSFLWSLCATTLWDQAK